MEVLRLSKPNRDLRGIITLDGSKSLSNRALIILALAGADPAKWLQGLSNAKDTQVLQQLLHQTSGAFDAGDAGTTFRFLTAWLALQPGNQILTGSPRMCQRPVGALVQALRELGADIRYMEQEGYPPLQIGEWSPPAAAPQAVRVQAGISSQFLSALLLIGPYLPKGLQLIPEGPLVSRPYLEMTMHLMRYFGASAEWQGNTLVVQPGAYQPRHLVIEADWSAASYWYGLGAFADHVDLTLEGLSVNSWQGDAVLIKMMNAFGIATIPATAEAGKTAVRLHKRPSMAPSSFAWDFQDCPDIAQTLAVVCGGLGVPGTFTGLGTLAVKETDRIAALQQELSKAGVLFGLQPAPGESGPAYRVSGKATWRSTPRFATYGDHRMAMAFAMFAMFAPVEIENPAVVAKSYPQFWNHLEQAGFHCDKRQDHVS